MIVCTFNVIQLSNFKTTRVYCHFKIMLHKGLNHCKCESPKTSFAPKTIRLNNIKTLNSVCEQFNLKNFMGVRT